MTDRQIIIDAVMDVLYPEYPNASGSPEMRELAGRIADRAHELTREKYDEPTATTYGGRPNHFYADSLGNPETCTEDHNHPEPGQSRADRTAALWRMITIERAAPVEDADARFGAPDNPEVPAVTGIIRWTRNGDMLSARLPETLTVSDASKVLFQGCQAGIFGFTDADGYRVIIPWSAFVDLVFDPLDGDTVSVSVTMIHCPDGTTAFQVWEGGILQATARFAHEDSARVTATKMRHFAATLDAFRVAYDAEGRGMIVDFPDPTIGWVTAVQDFGTWTPKYLPLPVTSCRWCAKDIVMMCRRGTDLCSITCEKACAQLAALMISQQADRRAREKPKKRRLW